MDKINSRVMAWIGFHPTRVALCVVLPITLAHLLISLASHAHP